MGDENCNSCSRSFLFSSGRFHTVMKLSCCGALVCEECCSNLQECPREKIPLVVLPTRSLITYVNEKEEQDDDLIIVKRQVQFVYSGYNNINDDHKEMMDDDEQKLPQFPVILKALDNEKTILNKNGRTSLIHRSRNNAIEAAHARVKTFILENGKYVLLLSNDNVNPLSSHMSGSVRIGRREQDFDLGHSSKVVFEISFEEPDTMDMDVQVKTDQKLQSILQGSSKFGLILWKLM